MQTKQKDRTNPKVHVPPKNSVYQINLEDQISVFLKSIRYATNDNDTAPGQSQSLASVEPNWAPGKMMSSSRNEKKGISKPYQREKPAVSKNSCEMIPSPALGSATSSSRQNQDGDKKNPVPTLKLEEQISSFLKSIRYSGTEGTKGSAQSSDSTEVKLKDFTGKMKFKEKDISKKSKPYMYIYKMVQKPKPKIAAENNYSNKDPKNQAICSKSATQCDNTRVLKRQSKKRQKDPSIATTCSKKHKLDSWTSGGLESLIKDFSRLTLN
ncbi:uncharacterized protein LOC111107275 [Crassostrea virginica]